MKQNNELEMKCDYYMKTVSYDHSEYCGDEGVIIKNKQYIIACLFDGLGHGEEAYEASNRAVKYIIGHEESKIIELVYGVHEALGGTRGCVGAFCRIHITSGEMEFVGIGNITARICGRKSLRMVSRGGVLGFGDIHPKQYFYKLCKGEFVLMYSDGVKDFFSFEECERKADGVLEKMCENILEIYGKCTDDRSCLLIKY